MLSGPSTPTCKTEAAADTFHSDDASPCISRQTMYDICYTEQCIAQERSPGCQRLNQDCLNCCQGKIIIKNMYSDVYKNATID